MIVIMVLIMITIFTRNYLIIWPITLTISTMDLVIQDLLIGFKRVSFAYNWPFYFIQQDD